jgi:hypothetical protein
MRLAALSAGPAVALLVAMGACSSANQAEPPPLGDCVSHDGSTCSTTVIGGGSSGGGGDAASCSVSAGGSPCGLCASASCCPELENCSKAAACSNLSSCEDDCTVPSCITECENEFPTGVGTMQVLSACVARDCVVCSESGTGDPCGAQFFACVAGVACNGSWCTKACARSSDCAGLGAGGASSLGTTNVCMATSTGDVCTPTCGAGGSCVDFPGTYCQSTTAIDGSAVSVCAFLPEASVTD